MQWMVDQVIIVRAITNPIIEIFDANILYSIYFLYFRGAKVMCHSVSDCPYLYCVDVLGIEYTVRFRWRRLCTTNPSDIDVTFSKCDSVIVVHKCRKHM
jgi:hypothetical protein